MKKLVCLLSTVGLFTLGSFAVPVWGADLASKDKDFVKEAANGGMMEVALGEMAQTMAQSDDVKKFGSLMVTDHGKANEELKKVAQQKKVSLPTKLDRKAKSTEKKLKKHSGADFDKAYMQEMVKD